MATTKRKTKRKIDAEDIPEVSGQAFKSIIAISVAVVAASFAINAIAAIFVPLVIVAIGFWAIAT